MGNYDSTLQPCAPTDCEKCGKNPTTLARRRTPYPTTGFITMGSDAVAVEVAYAEHDPEISGNKKVRKVLTVNLYGREYETYNWYGNGDGFVRQMKSMTPHSFDLIAASEYTEDSRTSTFLTDDNTNTELLLYVRE